MDKLREYLRTLTREQRDAFFVSCSTSEGYIRKASSIGQKLGPELCVRIERESGHAVTRKDLRPEDWELIWPELAVAAA